MITKEDMDAMGFSYYEQERRNKSKMTPQEMVTQYHETAGLSIGVKLPKSVEDFNNLPKKERSELVDLLELRSSLVLEEFEELSEAAQTTDYPHVLKEMADLVYVLYGMAVAYGWDLDEAVRRVHRNNMGRMYQPDGTIRRRDDGKILKNKDYPKVDLKDLV